MSRQSITDKSNPPKSEWFGYKYKVTPETSKLLQEAVFKDGGRGWGGDATVYYIERPYIFVYEDGGLTYSIDASTFEGNRFPEKQPPQVKSPQPTKVEPKKEFKVDKWYKCIDAPTGGELSKGEYYEVETSHKFLGLIVKGGGDIVWCMSRFDINSELDYDPNTKESVDKDVKESKINNTDELTLYRDDLTGNLKAGYVGQWTERLETNNFKPNDFSITKEESNMSTNNYRKTVTVNLIDRDSALDEKFALVATFGEFTTSKSSEALIRSIIIDPKNKVAELIAQHNEVRVKQTNKEIMERTGNKVTLEPVEESDLHWEIR